MALTRIQTDALKDAITSSNIADGTIVAADLASGAVTQPKLASGVLENYMANAGATYMFRNKLINGDFRIWQRGTTTTPGSGPSADMFKFEPRNGTTIYSDRSTDVPSGQNFTYSMRTYATQATDDGFHIRTGVELPAAGVYGEFQPGTTWTLSFWMKSAYTGRTINPIIQLANTMVGGSHQSQFAYSTQGVQTLTTSWQKYVFNFTMPTWVAESGSLSNVVCLSIRLLQGIDNTPQDTYLTGIQLEPGSVATPFEQRPLQVELALCQRYYIRLNTGQTTLTQGFGYAHSSTSLRCTFPLPVPMRTTPTFASSGDLALASNGTSFIATGATVVSSVTQPMQGGHVQFDVTGATTSHTCVYRTSADYVTFNAEL